LAEADEKVDADELKYRYPRWSYENAGLNKDNELCFRDQDISVLLCREIWLKLCPFLTIADDTDAKNIVERNILLCENRQCFHTNSFKNINYLGDCLDADGFFGLDTTDTAFPGNICERLAMGVRRLLLHGYTCLFIMQYDEAWIVGDLLGSIISAASGNLPIGDWYIFCVSSAKDELGSYLPGPPHRDRPTADIMSFREVDAKLNTAAVKLDNVEKSSVDLLKIGLQGELCQSTPTISVVSSSAPPAVTLLGSPKYCSVWLALTDATSISSCLYLIPKADDPGYHIGGDAIYSSVYNWRKIVAQPLLQGESLTFSHRLLHWGSSPQARHSGRGRIALSTAFADPSFEAEYFSHVQYMPFPPLGLRLGLIAGQSIQYEHLSPLDKHVLSLFRRIFHQQKQFFNLNYFDKISSASQFLLFQMKQNSQQRDATK
jgi:hypothetical protein